MTAMLAQNRRLEVLSSNVANLETAGYKQDNVMTRSFREMMIHRMNDTNDPSIFPSHVPIFHQNPPYVGPHSTGIHIDQIYIDFSQGPIEDTGRSTDFALAGDGFFVVETEAGERYTRSGFFHIDADGFLVTAAGEYILGDGGRIYLATENFVIDVDGAISIPGRVENGVYIDTVFIDNLRLVQFEDNAALRKQGANLYFLFDETIEAFPAEGVQVRQFALEMANIDMAGETTKMMEIFRAYELNQRFLRLLDENLGRAVNDIGRI
jgi:flagellar basal-body rod protein FlgG